MSNTIVPSNTINLRLPIAPDTKDPELFRELSVVYAALRQLQNGTDKYLDIPAHQKSSDYTLTYLDRGQSIDTSANITIPIDSDLPFPLGATILITNISTSTISIIPDVGVSLYRAGTVINGTRTLANFGMATLRYLGSNIWLIAGAGVI